MSTIPAIHGLLRTLPPGRFRFTHKPSLTTGGKVSKVSRWISCTTTSMAFFATREEIQREYRERNNGAENLVRANDVFFAVHAFTVSGIALWQTWVYKRDYNQKVSPIAGSLILTSALGIAVLIVAIHFDYAEWIDLMYYLSYIKLGVSFVKYVPQVSWLGCTRREMERYLCIAGKVI
ncbi:hypothetical protein BC937DRAFT_88742 [Endogone sp. FLAS-F59071]|nr:hypothetical protein BC937DRAFT_88742 [Endogone sp. FLAS-F59071]|eukprot:RUS18464.1 hypothetical protein BC937DRAFT_88742 [Endogone sp. FLAS-F59071]